MGKRAGLLAGLLVVTLGSGVVAQESSPEPPPWFSGRVETPAFALTLPDGWVAFDWTKPIDGQLSATVKRLEADGRPANLADLRTAIARGEGMGDCLVIIDTAAPVSCGLLHGQKTSPGEIGPGPLIASEIGERLLPALTIDPRTTADEAMVEVDLPAGPAVRLNMTVADPDRPYLSGPTTTYIVADGDRMLMATCSTAGARPDDDWLSIAETFEFLPAEE